MPKAQLKIDLIVDDKGNIVVDNFSKKTRKALDRIDIGAAKASKSIEGMTRSLMGFLGIYSGIEVGVGFAKAGIEAERMTLALEAGLGSMENAAQHQKWLRQESERLGLVFKDQVKGFAQLASAAKGTVLEGQKIREIYTGVATAASAMMLSQDDAIGVMKAFSQMIGKNKIQAEELRGQLGDRLPGAVQRFARAIGKTTEEVDEMMKKGELLATKYLPMLGKAFTDEFAEQAAKAAKTAHGQINNLKNAWRDFSVAVAEGGLLSAVSSVVKTLTFMFKNLDDMITVSIGFWHRMGIEIKYGVTEVIADLGEQLEDIKQKFLDLMGAFKKAPAEAKSWVGEKASDVGGWFSKKAAGVTNFMKGHLPFAPPPKEEFVDVFKVVEDTKKEMVVMGVMQKDYESRQDRINRLKKEELRLVREGIDEVLKLRAEQKEPVNFGEEAGKTDKGPAYNVPYQMADAHVYAWERAGEKAGKTFGKGFGKQVNDEVDDLLSQEWEWGNFFEGFDQQVRSSFDDLFSGASFKDVFIDFATNMGGVFSDRFASMVQDEVIYKLSTMGVGNIGQAIGGGLAGGLVGAGASAGIGMLSQTFFSGSETNKWDEINDTMLKLKEEVSKNTEALKGNEVTKLASEFEELTSAIAENVKKAKDTSIAGLTEGNALMAVTEAMHLVGQASYNYSQELDKVEKSIIENVRNLTKSEYQKGLDDINNKWDPIIKKAQSFDAEMEKYGIHAATAATATSGWVTEISQYNDEVAQALLDKAAEQLTELLKRLEVRDEIIKKADDMASSMGKAESAIENINRTFKSFEDTLEDIELSADLAAQKSQALSNALKDFYSPMVSKASGDRLKSASTPELQAYQKSLISQFAKLDPETKTFHDDQMEIWEKMRAVDEQLLDNANAQTKLSQDSNSTLKEVLHSFENARRAIDDMLFELIGGDLAAVQSREFFEAEYASRLAGISEGGTPEQVERAVSEFSDFLPKYLEFMNAYGENYKDVSGKAIADLKEAKAGLPEDYVTYEASGGKSASGAEFVNLFDDMVNKFFNVGLSLSDEAYTQLGNLATVMEEFGVSDTTMDYMSNIAASIKGSTDVFLEIFDQLIASGNDPLALEFALQWAEQGNTVPKDVMDWIKADPARRKAFEAEMNVSITGDGASLADTMKGVFDSIDWENILPEGINFATPRDAPEDFENQGPKTGADKTNPNAPSSADTAEAKNIVKRFSDQYNVQKGYWETYDPVVGRYVKRAKGGVIAGPELALIGEAGTEAVVPMPDGRSIPVSFSNGGSVGGGGRSDVLLEAILFELQKGKTININGEPILQIVEDGMRQRRQGFVREGF